MHFLLRKMVGSLTMLKLPEDVINGLTSKFDIANLYVIGMIGHHLENKVMCLNLLRLLAAEKFSTDKWLPY